MGRIRFLSILCAAAVCLPGSMAQAAEGTPIAYGAVIHDYARITFEWPEPVYFTARAHGKTVALTFDRRADPDFSRLLSQLRPYVVSARREHDGKTVLLTLDKPYAIRTFVSDTINGIDLLHIDGAAKPMQLADASPSPQALAALSPAAGKKKKKKHPASALDTPPAANPAPAATPPAAPAAPAAESKPPAPAPQPAAAPGSLKVSVSAAEDSAILRFPLTSRTAAAAFLRGHVLWIVFNQPHALDLSDFAALPKTVIGKPAVLSSADNTILRIPVSDGLFIAVAKEENAFDWAVLVTPQARALANPIAIAVQTDPPAPPHVFVPTLEMGDAITVNDPDIGDQLIVTPLFKPGEGIPAERDFEEFSLLQTAQGIAVQKIADEVAEVPLRNGLRISLPQGAALTPGLPDLRHSAQAPGLEGTSTLFPYALWKAADPNKFRAEARTLFQRIVSASTLQEATEARLRLAQLYLSEGLTVEALAELDGIDRTDPNFYRSAKLSAMRGATNFLMYRFVEASRDFATSELNNNKEMAYWRSMLSELLGNPDQQYDYLALYDDYISKYPPLFRQRLGIIAADRAVAAKSYNTALKILDTLQEEGKMPDSVQPYADFLLARIASETGREEDAQKMWDKLADDYDHPAIRARAEYARIAWGLEHGALDKDKAIERLERLRLDWHGDSLELNAASSLAAIYADKKDYEDAMRVWGGIVTSFPNTSDAIDATHKMEDTFVALFNEGLGDKLPPIDALALYYEYRRFTPPGPPGHDMILHVAQRLANLDLLDQAAALLDHEMRYESEKEERSHLGTTVAQLFLSNRQPQKAMLALADSVYGDDGLALRNLRNRMVAQALADQSKYDEALALLEPDKGAEANAIRQTIYWRQKDWPHLTSTVEAMLKARKDITAPATPEEGEALVKLAVAYRNTGDDVQLQYLRDYFGPLMAANPNKPVFDFITTPDITSRPDNFDAVMQSLNDTKSFIDNYHALPQMAQANAAPATIPTAGAEKK